MHQANQHSPEIDDSMIVTSLGLNHHRTLGKTGRVVGGPWAPGATFALLMGLGVACQQSSPQYIVEGPFGGVQAKRGANDQPSMTFVPSSLVRFEIRPERKADRGVYSTMYVEGPSGKLKRAPLDAVVPTESGGFSIEVEGSVLFEEGTGTYRLHVLISDRSNFPEKPTASELLRIPGLQPIVSVPVKFKQGLAVRQINRPRTERTRP